jgi:hypothetical protein
MEDEYEFTEAEFEMARAAAIRFVDEEPAYNTEEEFEAWFVTACNGDKRIALEACRMWAVASLASMIGLSPEEFGEIVNS